MLLSNSGLIYYFYVFRQISFLKYYIELQDLRFGNISKITVKAGVNHCCDLTKFTASISLFCTVHKHLFFLCRNVWKVLKHCTMVGSIKPQCIVKFDSWLMSKINWEANLLSHWRMEGAGGGTVLGCVHIMGKMLPPSNFSSWPALSLRKNYQR